MNVKNNNIFTPLQHKGRFQNVPHVFDWVQMRDTLKKFCDPKWFPMQSRKAIRSLNRMSIRNSIEGD